MSVDFYKLLPILRWFTSLSPGYETWQHWQISAVKWLSSTSYATRTTRRGACLVCITERSLWEQFLECLVSDGSRSCVLLAGQALWEKNGVQTITLELENDYQSSNVIFRLQSSLTDRNCSSQNLGINYSVRHGQCHIFAIIIISRPSSSRWKFNSDQQPVKFSYLLLAAIYLLNGLPPVLLWR